MMREEIKREAAKAHGSQDEAGGSGDDFWPVAVPRPPWAGGNGGADAARSWQALVDEVALHLQENGYGAAHRGSSPRPSVWRLANVAFCAAWATLFFVFGAAYSQGAQFASDKETATMWGG
eukprot:5544631-Prymnesium_polylepis.1